MNGAGGNHINTNPAGGGIYTNNLANLLKKRDEENVMTSIHHIKQAQNHTWS
jgi:hypothetical protein